MRRRDFIAGLGASVSVWPLCVRAQAGKAGDVSAQSNAPLVGFLNNASPATYRFSADAFREGLAQAGFVEGRNVRIEERWANGDYNALPALANELVAKGVVAIAGTGTWPPRGLRAAQARPFRSSSPSEAILCDSGSWRVSTSRRQRHGHRLRAEPARRQARAASARPRAQDRAHRVLLVNPDNPNVAAERADSEEGAARLGLQMVVQSARNADEIDTAFAELVRARIDAVIAATDPVLLDRRAQIAALAERDALPAISFTRQLAMAGLLMSYGPNIGWMYQQAGGYIGRILGGAKPAEMPVMQSIRCELVLNLRTAKRLGLTVPPAFLASVDDVIE